LAFWFFSLATTVVTEPTPGNESNRAEIHREGAQVETIRDRAANHRDRKCRETEDTRDPDFKIS